MKKPDQDALMTCLARILLYRDRAVASREDLVRTFATARFGVTKIEGPVTNLEEAVAMISKEAAAIRVLAARWRALA